MKVSKFNQMKIYERPFKPNELSYPYQYGEPVSKFRGVGGIFHFSQILKEYAVSKQWRSWSDAADCSVWLGPLLFAYVP